MSSEKSKYSSNSRQDGNGLSIDHQLVAIQTSASEAHYHSNFVDSNEIMAALIGPQVTIAPNTSTMSSPQSSPCSQPLLLTLGTSPRLQTLNSQPTSSTPSVTPVNISQNGFNSTGPYLRVIEQPTNRIRYRYKSEKGSHGGLTGENSTQTKKTYPMVRLENYRSSRQVLVKASLYTNEESPKPHIHKLMGKYCNEEGICVVPLGENNTAIFQNLGILFVGKKEVPEILFRQKLDEQRLLRALNDESNLSEEEKQKLKEEAEREAKRINLNSVKICFQAFECNNDVHYPICNAVFSRPVANQKSPDSGELKIVRMDKYSGVCTGDEEVYLLCEKVNKKEIKIRFFETDNEGSVLWEDFGNFTEADVHHQVAIVFRTPPYRDQNIENAVQVYLQLFRPKDGEYSEPRPFTYRPKEYDKDSIDIKRKKLSHYNPNYSGGHFGHFSGNGRYVASGDGNASSGQVSHSNDAGGLNYYGQGNNTHGYYRNSKPCETHTSRNGTLNMRCATKNNRDSLNCSSVFAQTMVQSLQRFATTGDLRSLLTPLRHLIAIPDEEGDTILHLWVLHQINQTKFINYFIELATSLSENVINVTNNLGQTVLHLAVILKKAELVSQLLRNGGNPNVRDLKGNTALHCACVSGDLSVINVLLNRRNYTPESNVPLVDQFNYEGLSPLHIAVKNGSFDVAKELIEFGANVNIREGKAGKNCLQLAIENHADLPVLKLLLSNESIDVNQTDYSGNTALHSACVFRSNSAIEILLDANVDLFVENCDYDEDAEDVWKQFVEDDCSERLPSKRGRIPADYYQELNELIAKRSFSKDEKKRKDVVDDEPVHVDSRIFDSGYGSKNIGLLDDFTLDKVSALLDPPSTDWQTLALFLGFEVDDTLKKEISPTKYIIERFEKQKGTLGMLETALEAAELVKAMLIVKEYTSVFDTSL